MKKLFATVAFAFLVSHAHATADDLAYFQQFLYKKEAIGDDPDYPEYQHRYLMSGMGQEVAMPDGSKFLIQLSVYMHADNSYLMIYRENKVTSGGGFFPVKCIKEEGQWSVPDTELVLGANMIGQRGLVHGRHGVKFVFKNDLYTPGVKGSEVLLDLGYSNVGPEAETFCF